MTLLSPQSGPAAHTIRLGAGVASDIVMVPMAPFANVRSSAAVTSTAKPRTLLELNACTSTISPQMKRRLSMSCTRLLSNGPPPTSRRQATSKSTGHAYQTIATTAHTRVKYLIEQTVASGLVYLNSHPLDFKNPEIRPNLARYLRDSNGHKAEERVKLLKVASRSWLELGLA
jgi:hypothetical protein